MSENIGNDFRPETKNIGAVENEVFLANWRTHCGGVTAASLKKKEQRVKKKKSETNLFANVFFQECAQLKTASLCD